MTQSDPNLCLVLSASSGTTLAMGFVGSDGKESACNAGDLGSIPGLGRSPGEGKGYPLQYSGLENSMDYIVHGVTKSRTRLSDSLHTCLDSEYITPSPPLSLCVCYLLGVRICFLSL